MARNNYSIQKNIKRNLPAYNHAPTDTGAALSRHLGRIFAIIISISIPISLITAGFVVSFKIPDVYSFELNRTTATEKIEYNDDKGLIADLMSDYMRHKTDTFILRAKMKDGSTESVFTKHDADSMVRYRHALDKLTFLLKIVIPLSVVGYLIIFLLSRKRALRNAIRASLFIYLGMFMAWGSMILVRGNVDWFTREIIGVEIRHSDILPRLFDAGLRTEVFLLALLISLIAMILLQALTAKLTKGYRIFNRTEE